MSIDASFEKLVEDLDDAALAGLSKAVARATAYRRGQNAIQLEDIHPRMSAEDRRRAQDEIARVLRGEQ
jgi:hypothetical protein